MNLQFSVYPGCWERHLQRQYKNPLFLFCAIPLTQDAIQVARSLDREEERAFEADFNQLLQEVTDLGNQEKISIALQIQERIRILYIRCAGLGGQHPIEKEGLLHLNQIILETIRKSAISDTYLIEQLNKQEFIQGVQRQHLEHSLVADLLHPNSPILQEQHLIPTLLSEKEPALRAALTLLQPQQQKIICQEARTLLRELVNEGYELPHVWRRLEVIEQDL